MKVVACLVALALFVVAESSVLPAYRGRHYFYGLYPGSCATSHDGMYYDGPHSFIVCTNGNAYQQSCPRGTANGPSKGYSVGGYYSHSDFCNINLNDNAHGYYRYHANAPYYHLGYQFGYPY